MHDFIFQLTHTVAYAGTLAITGLLVGNGVKRGLNTLVPPDVLAASSKTGQNYSSSVEDFLNEAGYTTADAYVQSQQVL